MLWDDAAHITTPALRPAEGLYHIWFSTRATQQYYPMLHSAFWLEWQLWQGNTFAYHVTNVAQHIIAAGLFWGVLRALQVPAAWLAALIFALHPVNVESVAWISEQKNTLSTIFYMGATWCYVTFAGITSASATPRRASWYWAALTLFVCGLLTKTVVATLPAALLLIIWWQRGRLDARRDVLPLVPWFALGIVAGLFTAWYEHTVIGAQGEAFELGPLQRTLLATRVIWFYLGKLLWPAELIFFYPRWVVDVTRWSWWAAAAALCAIVALLIFVAGPGRAPKDAGTGQAQRAPLAAFLIYAGTLVPVLGFFNVYPFRFSYVADHFQYLAQFALIALAAGGAARWARQHPSRRPIGIALACVIVVALGWRTWAQSHQYGRDALFHYQAIVDANPRAWVAYGNWASVLMERGEYEAAIPLLRTAIGIEPRHYEAHRDLAAVLERQGRLDEALTHYEAAAGLDSDPKRGEHAYGLALLRRGRVADAIAHLERAIAIADGEQSPIYSFYVDLGGAYATAGRLEDAVAQYRLAFERAGPDYPLPAADALLGDALVRLKRYAEAEPHLRRATAADPSDAVHRFDLGKLLYDAGRYEEARRYLSEALSIRPDLVDAYVGLAFTYHALAKSAEARETAARAVQVGRQVLGEDAARRIEADLAPVLNAPATTAAPAP